ncbi:hypothetical protein M2317_001314 [Microbacterium sp. ZKA21]|uniref:hypothetical protein n=1 Tax=Microbacterium sp. ZKA21 TaxID=3381694 RepID=UPI003D1B95D2
MANYSLSGRIDPLGELKKYPTFRSHARGPMSLRVDKIVDGSGNLLDASHNDRYELRIGLRRQSDGKQIVVSSSWFQHQMGQTRQLVHEGPYTATTPPSIIPAGSYAVNARLAPSFITGGTPPVTWHGLLVL